MSRILVTYMITEHPPETVQEIYWTDLEVDINLIIQELIRVKRKRSEWDETRRVVIKVRCRRYGDFDDEFRQRMLRHCYYERQINARSAFKKETKVKKVEMVDDNGFLEWFGFVTKKNAHQHIIEAFGPDPHKFIDSFAGTETQTKQ